MITMESALIDTKYDLELEQIQNKIRSLYRDLLTKAFKKSNPGASIEEISSFIEENDLEFLGEGFDEEAEDLESLLELLSKEDDLDRISERNFEKPDVESGKKLKSKTNEKTTTPSTVPLKIPKGGLFAPKDIHKIPKTASLKVPTGGVKKIIDEDRQVNIRELKDIWDEEREKLLKLVRSRNKEFGVRL